MTTRRMNGWPRLHLVCGPKLCAKRRSRPSLAKGATATGCFGVGRAEDTVDKSAGAAGAISLTYRAGQFAFANLASDLITQAEVGKVCYIVDDQTVAKTNGTGTRSPAGIVEGIEGTGVVWVRFDEAVTRAS
jgi:hypothetical protein